jgi:uncharacterized protein (UPF0548 family)
MREGLTYAEVGATRGDLPEGYQHLVRSAWLGTGPETFDRAVRALMTWEVQRRAGVAVLGAPASVTEGASATLRIGPRLLGVRAPVRVVHVIDEPGRKGFAYGTLPGHPESGEESFVVEQWPDGAVTIEIRAFSRPASLLARLGGPATRAVQRHVTERYLAALRE